MIRYTSEGSDHPECQLPLSFEVLQSVRKQLGEGDMITILTNGPLTNLAIFSHSDQNASIVIEVCFLS
jgi:inosine-uridine nucleoside N-ribohydrolase